jgi:hypothetical protein
MTHTSARYDFLPWLRRGAATEILTPDPLSGPLPRRGLLSVEVTVTSNGGASPLVDKPVTQVELHGPGDVVGIDPRHIIRCDPPSLTQNFEPNYLAAIEFDQPHFPWMYTPAGPAAPAETPAAPPSRLRPWISLIVLTDDEFTRPTRNPDPLPAIEVIDAITLPDLSESWAWAHAQVAGGVGAEGLEATVTSTPGRATSRLLSSRRLRPKTHYTAFLVPAFDLGVAAGLGAAPPSATQAGPAWAAGAVNLILPYYFSFEFRTSSLGDFESLVRRLQPRHLPKEVGMRPMAVDTPGWGKSDAGGPLGLSGALCSLQTVETDWTGTKRADFRESLETSLNRGVIDNPAQDPVVTPPMYGRWHAASTSVDRTKPGWVNELNLDPRSRVMAGFGTRVVLDQRDHLLAAAWKQVQGIEEVNRKLRYAQLARLTEQAVYQQRLKLAQPDRLLTLTAAVHKRLLASPRTVHATIERSRLPVSALSAAFRRITRSGGPIARRLGVSHLPGSIVSQLNSGEIDPIAPRGRVLSLEDVADSLYPQWLPRCLRKWLRYAFWTLIVIGIVAALLALPLGRLFGMWPGAIAAAGAVAAVFFGLALLSLKFKQRWHAAEMLRFKNITPEAVDAVPPRPNFRAARPGQHPTPQGTATTALGAPDSPEAARFRAAARRIAEILQRKQPEPPMLPPADIPHLAATILTRLDPETTIPTRIAGLIAVGGIGIGVLGATENGNGGIPFGPKVVNGTIIGERKGLDPLEEIMAAPDFPQPMYAPLRDTSQELLLPGLNLVPPDTLGLLKENHAFIEAYHVGLNHEMGRQLLFNGYPTDQRGSYFRQFWDVKSYVPTALDPTDPDQLGEQLKDIPPIHDWPRAERLGGNVNRPTIKQGGLVLLIRGELLMRYPNATVYATEAVLLNGKRALGSQERHPLFTATLSPDVTLLGFDLTEAEACGSQLASKPQGWYIVFQQNPSAPHFGLEPAPEPYVVPTVTEWNQLSWANFAGDATALDALQFLPVGQQPQIVTISESDRNPGDSTNAWGQDAAQTAFIGLIRPVRVGVHAETMLPLSTTL